MSDIEVQPLFGNNSQPQATNTQAAVIQQAAPATANPATFDVGYTGQAPLPVQIQPQVVTPQPVSTALANLPKENDLDALTNAVGKGYGEASAKLMAMHKTADLDEMGKGINGLLLTAKGLNPNNQKGGLISKLKTRVYGEKENLLAHTQSVQQRLNELCRVLDQDNAKIQQEIQTLDAMKRDNLQDQIRGKQAIQTVQNWMEGVKNALAVPMRDPNDIQEVNQRTALQHMQQRLGPMLASFQDALVLYQQMANRLQTMQDTARTITAQFQQIKMIAIPALTGLVGQQLINMDQKRVMETESAMMDMTNEAIRLAAEAAGQNAVTAATLQQKSVISIDELIKAQDILEQADAEIKKIQEQGEIRRKEDDAKRAELEKRLLKTA